MSTTAMETSRIRMLVTALRMLGSEKALSDTLAVNPVELSGWLGGGNFVPDRIYLAALHIVALGPFDTRSRAIGASCDDQDEATETTEA